MGSFCGRFHDDLEGSDDEDEDDYPEGKRMRNRKQKKKTKKPTKEDTQNQTAVGLRWAHHINHIQVMGKDNVMKPALQVSVHKRPDLQGMMNSIQALGKVHTIEIVACEMPDLPANINDVDFSVLKMTNNHITKFSEVLAKCRYIEQIILNVNHITEVPQGVFGNSFQYLEVINLSDNRLSYLPPDFGMTTNQTPGNSIKYIDLSLNSLIALPDSILMCRRLETLNVSHNRLKELPEPFKGFKNIQKLFLSFNSLTRLPADIGACKSIIKIRIVDNNISRLPNSMLDLWQKKGGRLEEFLVDRNPLTVPSITAFEMGGEDSLNRAFHLFEEYVEEEQALQEKRNQKVMRAQLHDATPVGEEERPLALTNTVQAINTEDAPTEKEQEQESFYYFAHCNSESPAENKAKIKAIRNAESTVLLVKKTAYVEMQMQIAAEAHRSERNAQGQSCGFVPDDLKIFLDENFQPQQYNGKVYVTDLDLYFCLLVFSTKPMFSTVALLYDKYERAQPGERGYMTQEEFGELVRCAPVSLDEYIDPMWRLMSWRDPDKLFFEDFVAAWHVHDIEEKDPWISRIASVLHLEYYHMNVLDLKARLRAKNAKEATPILDFEKRIHNNMFKLDKGEEGGRMGRLHNTEGLRNLKYSPLMNELRQNSALDGLQQKHDETSRKELMSRVSMDDTQHILYEQERRRNDDSASEVLSEVASVFSANLSDRSEEEDDDGFDALIATHQSQVQPHVESGAQLALKLMNIENDADLKRLMEIGADDLWIEKGPTNGQARDLAPMGRAPKKNRSKMLTMGEQHIDAKMNTDVFEVRRMIRRVYRSVPYEDFVTLINFLLRGLNLIKHSPPEAFTWWHSDDPTFKCTVGNDYSRSLLMEMGFVRLRSSYWVWPYVHLDHRRPSLSLPMWADEFVPTQCPGKDPNRLDDMISLLRSCQRALHQKGSSFTGHFKTLDD